MGNISNLSFSPPAEHLAPLYASHYPPVALRSEFESIFIMVLAGGPKLSIYYHSEVQKLRWQFITRPPPPALLYSGCNQPRQQAKFILTFTLSARYVHIRNACSVISVIEKWVADMIVVLYSYVLSDPKWAPRIYRSSHGLWTLHKMKIYRWELHW